MMTPLEAIEADPPNVWLTSFDGFEPEQGGYVGFANKVHRARFVRSTAPGVLILIWATSKAPRQQRGRVVGILQVSHERGTARDFMSPDAYARKQADVATRDRWDFAVRAVRAWRILPNNQERVAEFAPRTYFTSGGTERATFLGSQGDRLDPEAAKRLLALMVEEVEVFGQPQLSGVPRGVFESLARPSRPGPVSQEGYWVEPAEGPKHIYVLRLSGKAPTFLNDPSALGKVVLKPGLSSDPDKRCSSLNLSFPRGAAFQWSVHTSTEKMTLPPFPNSGEAKVAEKAMQDFVLAAGGTPLGNEFFLLEKSKLDDVLKAGLAVRKTVA